jgi:hypothetical protein
MTFPMLPSSQFRIGLHTRSLVCVNNLKIWNRPFGLVSWGTSSVESVEVSVLLTEMVSLESQEEDVPRHVLWFKSMSWLGKIRSHHRNENWTSSFWQTFFASCVGANVPVLTELPFLVWDCRKFQIDTIGDHLFTCTTHSGVNQTHDWVVDRITDLFLTTHKVKTQQVT